MALEHTLLSGVADAVLRAAGRAGAEAWERGAVPRPGRTQAPPAQVGVPTPQQRQRAERNRAEALARRAARLEAEAAAAEALDDGSGDGHCELEESSWDPLLE